MTIDASERPVLTQLTEARPVPRGIEMSVVAGPEFDDVVATADGACQEQTYAFNRSRYPKAAIEPLIFRVGGKIIGASLMMIQRLPLGIGAIAVTKWGPAVIDDTDRTAYGLMVEALQKEYADRRGLLLSVMPRVRPEAENPDYQTLLALGFEPGEARRNPERYLVDLRLSDDAMRKGFEQKWRNRLNKAEKSGLSFERVGMDGLPTFTTLFNEMKGRKGIIDRTAFATVSDLLGHANPDLRAELFMVRSAEGQPLAGAIVFKAGDMPFYIYGATGADALPLSAGHFINYNVMRWLRDNTKARWYNLGGTDGNAGLETFKLGLIGKTGLVRPFPPMATYASNWRARLVGKGAWAARELLQAFKRKIGR